VIGAMKMKDICFELEKIGSASSFHSAGDAFARLESEFIQVQRELAEKSWKN
jgi:hypothetical protein